MYDFFLDESHVVRAASGAEADGSTSVYVPDTSGAKGWNKILTSTPLRVDSLHPVKWSETGRLLMLSSVGRETVALVALDLDKEGQTVVYEGTMDMIWFKAHAWSGKVQFVSTMPGRTRWTVIDESVRADFDRLATYAKSKDADFDFFSYENKSDDVWIVSLVYSDAPSSFILYHRNLAVTLPGVQEDGHFECLFTSNSKTLNDGIAPYMDSYRTLYHARMGHPELDAELLVEVSPLFHAHKIVRPLMISHGKNNPRVKQSESEQIVHAIEKNGGNVYYVLYTDEGHGFTRPVNRIDRFQKAELFLSKYMDDKVRTQDGLSLFDNVEGSSAVVRIVGDLVGK